MTEDWFEELMGFKERPYPETKRHLAVVGKTLRSSINGCSYAIGDLETPSLSELRDRAATLVGSIAGKVRVSNVAGDVGAMHRVPENKHAMFQVASQFNLLEMSGPDVGPEDGVTRYRSDRTQGPACAMAAGAATVYRNYCVPLDGHTGQTRDRQLDCLRDLGVALGNRDGALWTMRNGYALCTDAGLTRIDRTLRSSDASERDSLRDLLRIGIHWDIQVSAGGAADMFVSQAFCSALPMSYTGIPAERWSAFARLVLEGAYEATLWAAVINAHRFSSNVLFLTELGGGAFGNDAQWIHDAMRRALRMFADFDLDVRLVSYRAPTPELERFVREFA
jgi:hypothetical protein